MPITLLLLDHDALSQVQVACKGMAVLLPVPMRTSEFCHASPSSQENRDCKRSLLVAEGECLWDTPGIAPWSSCLSSPGVDDPHQHGRGVALADFNRDGKVDIVYGNWNGPHRLYLQMSAHGKVRFRVRTARCCMAAGQTIRDRNLLCASMGLSRAGGGGPKKGNMQGQGHQPQPGAGFQRTMAAEKEESPRHPAGTLSEKFTLWQLLFLGSPRTPHQ